MSGTSYRLLWVFSVGALVVSSLGCGGEEAEEKVPKANLSAAVKPSGELQDSLTDYAALAVQLQADEANADSPAVTPENFYPEVLISTSLGDIRLRLNA